MTRFGLRLALALASAAALTGRPAYAASPFPPDGTYTYEITQGGKAAGSSTVTIVRRSGAIVVSENASLGPLQATTRATFDAQTLRESHYALHSGQSDVDVDVSGTSATLRAGGASLPMHAADGTNILVSDGLVSSFALLPALAKALAPLAFATTLRPHVAPLTVSASKASPPPGARAGDVGIDVVADVGAFSLWYDPTTLVLDRFEFPAIGFEYRLTRSSPTVETLAAPASPLPQPSPVPLSAAHYVSREVRFASRDGVMLAGTLTLPQHRGGPLPAVVLIHGSGPLDRDETIGPNKVFLQIAHALSNRGFAVLRYDKRGNGTSGGNAIAATRQDLLGDAEAAVRFLASDTALDRARLFVLGHSEGAELAPSLAADLPFVRGIVLLAPPALPLEQVLVKQLMRGRSEAAAAVREDALREIEAVKNGTSTNPSAAWLRTSFGIDPAELIAKVPCPILILQGGKDIQVFASDLPRLVDAARAAKRDVSVRVFPDDDHLFIPVAVEPASPGAEYAVPSLLDPAMLNAAGDWLAARSR